MSSRPVEALGDEGVAVCPKCGLEFRPTYTRCPYCSATLERVQSKPPPLELATVFSTQDEQLLAVAISVLESAQVRCLVRAMMGSPTELLVRAEDAEDARRLLEAPGEELHRGRHEGGAT